MSEILIILYPEVRSSKLDDDLEVDGDFHTVILDILVKVHDVLKLDDILELVCISKNKRVMAL